MNRSYGVFFDMNTNRFIKLNKQTGEEHPSYKNGAELRKFKPFVTGFDYQIRKLSGLSLHKTIAYQKSNTPKKVQKVRENTIELPQQVKYKKPKLDFIGQSPLNRSENISPRSTFFYTAASSGSQQKETNKFAMTIKRFTEINTSKFNENQSPRKDTIPGSSPSKDLSEIALKTLSSFEEKEKMQNALDSVIRAKHEPKIPFEYPYSIQIRNQFKRQNQQFLKFHPQYLVKEDSSAKIRLQDRKNNLKKLQKLFISNNNRSTSPIYESN